MINKNNLVDVLKYLNFIKKGNSYVKHYSEYSCDMMVDLSCLLYTSCSFL